MVNNLSFRIQANFCNLLFLSDTNLDQFHFFHNPKYLLKPTSKISISDVFLSIVDNNKFLYYRFPLPIFIDAFKGNIKFLLKAYTFQLRLTTLSMNLRSIGSIMIFSQWNFDLLLNPGLNNYYSNEY